MIQRIQSVFLLGSLIAGLLLLFLPLAEIQSPTQEVIVQVSGIHVQTGDALETHGETSWVMYLVILLLANIALGIFMFKNRVKQMKVVRLASLLTLIVIAGAAYAIESGRAISAEDGVFSPGFTLVLPLIIIVLNVMAGKAIKKDDELVRSADRLR